MQSIFDWLVTLSPGTLYTVLALTAAVENIFPPFPADVVVAFGSFVVAQGQRGALLGVFLVTWLANISTAMLVYALGRRYGAERLEQRLGGRHAKAWDTRVRRMFDRFGMPAIFVSRFVPGVRAIVPAVAGALRVPVGRTAIMIAAASGIWYGLITVVAYRLGSDWQQVSAAITRYNRIGGIVAGAVLVLAMAAWVIARRRRE